MTEPDRQSVAVAAGQRSEADNSASILGHLWSLVSGASLLGANNVGNTGLHTPHQSFRPFRETDSLMSAELCLRCARSADYDQWYSLRESSRDHLTTWEPAWRVEDVTRKAFVRRLKADAAQLRAGRRYAFLVFSGDEKTLLGGISLSDIRLGNRRSGSVGYWIGEQHKGQGVGTCAMEAITAFAFERLNLNRIEAACQPGNLPSLRLLRRCGFLREGVATDYLKINGEWRDHEIWACTQASYKHAQEAF